MHKLLDERRFILRPFLRRWPSFLAAKKMKEWTAVKFLGAIFGFGVVNFTVFMMASERLIEGTSNDCHALEHDVVSRFS